MTKKIAFCAGHGMHTIGKQDPNGVKEWYYNNKVVKAFVAHLNAHYEGFELLRTDDPTGKVDVPLKTRTDKANDWKADIYVSFHHNANTGKFGTWGGVETLVQSPLSANPSSLALARLVHPKVLKAMGLRDRGIKAMNLHITRETKMPSILIEGGFMDSLTDIVALRDDAKLKAQGEAVAEGVAEYLKLAKKEVIPQSQEKIGVAKMLVNVQAYEKPSFSSAKTRVYKKGVERNIYQNKDGFYLTYSGDWIPINYGKNFSFEPVSKPVNGTMYRVITGSFSKRELADSRIKELKDKGFESFIDVYKP